LPPSWRADLKVGFYLSAQQPVERVLPQIARKALLAGGRLLVVASEEDLLDRLDRALWEEFPEDFLAHGYGGQPNADRQPILLSRSCEAENSARMIALADGQWREEASTFDRAFLFFDDAGRGAARKVWAGIDTGAGIEREFFEYENGKWERKA
jgi:DNA polymerase-3 subunit chi